MSFLSDQLAVIEASIVAHQAAAAELASGGIQSYTFNSGQTQQTVTYAQIDALNRVIDELYNRYTVLAARVNGATVIARPCW